MDFDFVVSGDEQCVPQKVNAPVPADPQPMLPSTTAPVPSVNDPTICERCVSAGLLKRSANTPPHSDIEAKRAHRRWVITRLAAHPCVATAAILLLDDRLPTADATGWSYLTDDILGSEDALGDMDFKVGQLAGRWAPILEGWRVRARLPACPPAWGGSRP